MANDFSTLPRNFTVTPGERVRALASLCELVEVHNRYYPIEANLPMDRLTGRLLDGGKPWVPLPRPTFETLLARAENAP